MSQDVPIGPELTPDMLRALGLRVSIVAVDGEGSPVPEAVSGADPGDSDTDVAWRRFGPELAEARSGSVASWAGWSAHPKGQPRWLEHVFGPGPRPGEVLIVTRDVTARKHREAELERRNEQLGELLAGTASVVASSLDCIIVVDAEGRVVEFNPAAEATFGYLRADTIGRPVAELIIPKAMRDPHHRGMRRYEQTGVPHMLNRRVELEAMRADGTLFPVELSIVDLKSASGRLYAAHLRDLTVAKAAQGEIERQQIELRETEKHRLASSLLSGVAHELNNPLAILLAQTTLLQGRAESEDARIRAGKIHAAAERAARIIKSFLDLACERPPERRPTDVNDVIERALEMTAYGRRSAGIEFVFEPGQNLGLVLADAQMLGQAITTLLLAATRALSDRPGPRGMRLASHGAADAVVVQLDHSGDPRPDGTAPDMASAETLAFNGLAMSRDIVASHSGTLESTRDQDGRARFTLSLPLLGTAPAHGSAGDRHEDDSLSILIVDDERDVAEALADILDIIGHRTSVVDTAADAVTRAGDPAIDVIVADLRMPVVSGVELYRHVVARRPEMAGRFVLVTGDAVGAREAARECGPDGSVLLLEKPFSIRSVRAVLDGLGRSGRTQPPRT